jgi:uncharacterized membrane protein YqjE
MAQGEGTGIVQELSGAFASARGLLSSVLDLFTLEARRAGLSLVLMLTCGAVGAILVVAAWVGLMAALVLHAVALGVRWETALGAAAIANFAAAMALFWLCLRVSRELRFAATRRQLRREQLEPI